MNWDEEMDKFYSDPQQQEQIPWYICEKCGREIYEGDTFWNIDGNIYCDIECGTEESEKLFRKEAGE